MHAQEGRQLADLQPLRCSLRGITTLLAVIRSIGRQIFDRCEVVQAASQCGRGGARSGRQLAFLVLELYIETQVGHGVKSVGSFAAFVAHDAALKLAIEGAVEKALAFGTITLRVPRCCCMEGINEKLEVLMGILLTISSHILQGKH